MHEERAASDDAAPGLWPRSDSDGRTSGVERTAGRVSLSDSAPTGGGTLNPASLQPKFRATIGDGTLGEAGRSRIFAASPAGAVAPGP